MRCPQSLLFCPLFGVPGMDAALRVSPCEDRAEGQNPFPALCHVSVDAAQHTSWGTQEEPLFFFFHPKRDALPLYFHSVSPNTFPLQMANCQRPRRLSMTFLGLFALLLLHSSKPSPWWQWQGGTTPCHSTVDRSDHH